MADVLLIRIRMVMSHRESAIRKSCVFRDRLSKFEGLGTSVRDN